MAADCFSADRLYHHYPREGETVVGSPRGAPTDRHDRLAPRAAPMKKAGTFNPDTRNIGLRRAAARPHRQPRRDRRLQEAGSMSSSRCCTTRRAAPAARRPLPAR
jgi:hypothetical protein